MLQSRREFIQRGLGGVTLLATGRSLPGFLGSTALAATPDRERRVLVVIQLTGGNDGLNTVVPLRDERYFRARPTLRIPPQQALRVSDELGLHPEMSGFKRLFDQGLLTVVNNVGYPNPDRSHFRALDIWHTARVDPELARDGWLGRVVDHWVAQQRAAAANDPSQAQAPTALHLAAEALPLALKSQRTPVVSVRDIAAFRLEGEATALGDVIAAPRSHDSTSPSSAALDDLLFVQRVALSSCATARRIESVARDQTLGAPYPPHGLAQRLQQIAKLIAADFGPRVYYTSLDGFDTHARQLLAHGPLLRELSGSVAAFYDDLTARGLAERVLLLTFSEFGRRVAENGGQGTDHGAAAPMFLAGPACRGGVIGAAPDLGNLIEGDLPHKLDFRDVYAAILQDWLSVPPAVVLGPRAGFDAIELLRAAAPR